MSDHTWTTAARAVLSLRLDIPLVTIESDNIVYAGGKVPSRTWAIGQIAPELVLMVREDGTTIEDIEREILTHGELPPDVLRGFTLEILDRLQEAMPDIVRVQSALEDRGEMSGDELVELLRVNLH